MILLGLLAATIAAAQPAEAVTLTRSQVEVKHMIRRVFPVHYREAQRVAYCESKYGRRAVNGQYAGVFQLSSSWRAHFEALMGWRDVATNPWENTWAAHRIYLGQGWAPWTCGWAAGASWAPR